MNTYNKGSHEYKTNLNIKIPFVLCNKFVDSLSYKNQFNCMTYNRVLFLSNDRPTTVVHFGFLFLTYNTYCNPKQRISRITFFK